MQHTGMSKKCRLTKRESANTNIATRLTNSSISSGTGNSGGGKTRLRPMRRWGLAPPLFEPALLRKRPFEVDIHWRQFRVITLHNPIPVS